MRSTPDRPRLSFSVMIGPLVLGALWGAGQMGGALALMGLAFRSPIGGLLIAMFVFPVALVIWMLGLLVFGAPGWAVPHALGLRSRWIGATFGVLGAALALPLFADRLSGLHLDHGARRFDLLVNAAALGVIGAVVGWVVFNAAYDREGNLR